jgi:2-keto-3-deoxy-L-rhamnonate aldolase RhmA
MKGFTGELKRRVKRRDTLLFGCIMDSHSGAVVEMYHETGFDAIMIDREHTALNSETIREHIRLARALELPCMVRAADNSYHEVCRFLDQGADGVFMPRIRTRQEAERYVAHVKYPPVGLRGIGPSTCPAGKYVGWNHPTEMADYSNESLVVGIQIETAEALADLDGILSVPGIDVAVVGNDDLSLGMGILGQLDSPQYINAVKSVIAACERHGVLPGIAGGDPTWVRYWHDQGMRLFWCAADIVSMWTATRTGIAAIQASLAAEAAPESPFPATSGQSAPHLRYSKD